MQKLKSNGRNKSSACLEKIKNQSIPPLQCSEHERASQILKDHKLSATTRSFVPLNAAGVAKPDEESRAS